MREEERNCLRMRLTNVRRSKQSHVTSNISTDPSEQSSRGFNGYSGRLELKLDERVGGRWSLDTGRGAV
jgi:hypothetical protein